MLFVSFARLGGCSSSKTIVQSTPSGSATAVETIKSRYTAVTPCPVDKSCGPAKEFNVEKCCFRDSGQVL